MKTIETVATVTPDGQLIVQGLSDIPVGEHKIVLIIDETPLFSGTQNGNGQKDDSGSDVSEPTGNVWDLLESLAGTIEMPEDWAVEHDHYLYGTPKRYSKTDSFVVMQDQNLTEAVTADQHFVQAGYRALLLEPL